MARLRRIDSCRETTGRHVPCDSKVIGAFARLSQEFEPAQASLQRKSLWVDRISDECRELILSQPLALGLQGGRGGR